jgi:hypothetical protein
LFDATTNPGDIGWELVLSIAILPSSITGNHDALARCKFSIISHSSRCKKQTTRVSKISFNAHAQQKTAEEIVWYIPLAQDESRLQIWTGGQYSTGRSIE